jgi:capsid protein
MCSAIEVRLNITAISMLNFLSKLNPFGRKRLEASSGYDLLRNRDCSDNWQEATRNNATITDSRENRQELRDLARYEERNNPHLRGVLNKLVAECIGTGPRLSIDPKVSSDRANRAAARVERNWKQWCEEVNFIDMLRLMFRERIVGGESFFIVYPDTELAVPLRPVVYEADQIQTPYWDMKWDRNQTFDGRVDGIIYDNIGRVIGYDRLVYHPYGNQFRDQAEAVTVSAEYVWHWFMRTRPSMHRGVSEVAPTLEVYSRLRRFIESKVKQEELRAKMLGVIETAFPPDICADIGNEPENLMISDGQFTTLPDGWKAQLFKLDVTGEGVSEFTKTCLSWATQALMVPWNIASGDSSDYNFASGRLDHMLFHSYVRNNRADMVRKGLDWFFENHWLPMARLSGQVPADLINFDVKWYWDNMKPIDEKKSADAATTLKDASLLDEVTYWREQGEDASDVARRQIKFELEKKQIQEQLEEEMGVKLDDNQAQKTPTADPEDSTDDVEDVGQPSVESNGGGRG